MSEVDKTLKQSKLKVKKPKQLKTKKIKMLKPKLKERLKKRAVSKVVRQSRKGAPLAPILQMLVVIVERGHGDEVTAFLKKHGIIAKVTSFGGGTADSNLQSMLGLYNKEKEIVWNFSGWKNTSRNSKGRL